MRLSFSQCRQLFIKTGYKGPRGHYYSGSIKLAAQRSGRSIAEFASTMLTAAPSIEGSDAELQSEIVGFYNFILLNDYFVGKKKGVVTDKMRAFARAVLLCEQTEGNERTVGFRRGVATLGKSLSDDTFGRLFREISCDVGDRYYRDANMVNGAKGYIAYLESDELVPGDSAKNKGLILSAVTGAIVELNQFKVRLATAIESGDTDFFNHKQELFGRVEKPLELAEAFNLSGVRRYAAIASVVGYLDGRKPRADKLAGDLDYKHRIDHWNGFVDKLLSEKTAMLDAADSTAMIGLVHRLIGDGLTGPQAFKRDGSYHNALKGLQALAAAGPLVFYKGLDFYQKSAHSRDSRLAATASVSHSGHGGASGAAPGLGAPSARRLLGARDRLVGGSTSRAPKETELVERSGAPRMG